MDIGKTILGMTLAFYTGFYIAQTKTYFSGEDAQRISAAVSEIEKATDEVEKRTGHINQILRDIKVKRPELFEQREYEVPQGLTYKLIPGPARHTNM
ncbi:MAG: hypothetical protein WCV90_07670 [Candidatus Woesearchaeota archaeon]|jgi:hypothetical protein